MSCHSKTLIFSKKLFDEKTDRHTKHTFSKYLKDMDGKTVELEGEHGTIELDDGDYIYPVYREWCEVKTEEQIKILG